MTGFRGSGKPENVLKSTDAGKITKFCNLFFKLFRYWDGSCYDCSFNKSVTGAAMSKKHRLSEEERALFREAMADVKPLPSDKIAPKGKKLPPRPVQREREHQQVLRDMMVSDLNAADLETGDELLFARNGLHPNTLRKLRRGKFRIEAELDLHRLTSEQARQETATFLAQCKALGKRCVRIIHGKGLGSFDKKPVLKGKVDIWLRRHDDVLAYCSARPVDGGTGAVYVLIKKA
jgi:DNA-nicking Smr family endonuclease